MNGKAALRADADCLHLSGNVDFGTVTAVLTEGEKWLKSKAPAQCCVDLKNVERCNSAGMALLLAWLRTARQAGKQMEIRHVPDMLAAIIQLAGLEEELKVTDSR